MASSPNPTWLSARSDDGTELRIARWGDGDKDVLIVHGLAEHADRYGHVAAALVEAGWRVTLVELRGHGKSGGRRGHTRFWHRYVEDVQAAASSIGRPFVMLGHSMGGLVALDALREPITPRCTAVALSNPFLGTAFEPPRWKVVLGDVLTHVFPILPVPTDLDTTAISRDPEVVAAYESDPMVYGTITPRWGTEMQKAQDRVKAYAGQYDLPLLMMLGTGDRICDHKAGEAIADGWGSSADKQVYEGWYHELFNEVDKDRAIGDLVAWLDRLPASDG